MRTEQVVTSFESRVKGQALLMVGKEPGEVDGDKEIVMPESDHEEAVERLAQVETGQEIAAFAYYETRLARGCAAGHLAVETALKSLIHLSSSPEAQLWGHKIDELLRQLPDPHKSEIETLLAAVGVKNFRSGNYRPATNSMSPPPPRSLRRSPKRPARWLSIPLISSHQTKR